jgi:hypothetical protein
VEFAVPPWLDELHLAVGPPWHAMGTRSLPFDSWLLADDARVDDLALKRRLLRDAHADVVAYSPGTSAGDEAREVASLVAEATGVALEPDPPPLEAAALVVQEDLCLLLRRRGCWRLAAGVVCFPSMWRLRDKLGLPITDVHERVPSYGEELAERVDNFVDRLRPDRPVWRRNWFVHDSPVLHLLEPPPEKAGLRVPEDLWLRSERQTLRRLPASGAVLFTIRTQQAPLAVLAGRPDIAARMAAVVAGWSPALIRYRHAESWGDQLRDWLTSV